MHLAPDIQQAEKSAAVQDLICTKVAKSSCKGSNTISGYPPVTQMQRI